MNPQQTLILEQRRRANCLNKNMRKMHENSLPLELRLNSICVDIAWSKEAFEAFALNLHVFGISLMGLSAISMQFLGLKGYDFEDLLCFRETVFHAESNRHEKLSGVGDVTACLIAGGCCIQIVI